MATVHFKLKEINADRPTPIYLVFSFGYYKMNPETGKKVYLPLKYSTRIKVHPKYWNNETARVSEVMDLDEARDINDRLNEIEFNIQDIYRKLIDKKIQILPWVLSRELNLRMGRKSKKRSLNFYDFAEKFIEHAKIKKSAATIAKYNTTISHIKAYSEYSGKKVDFETINLNFYKDFTRFLREELAFSQNTIAKYVAALKLILNEATVKGVNKNLNFKHKSFKIKTEKGKDFYLNESELDRIKSFKSEIPKIQENKDVFLLLCYTGLTYNELLRLRKEDIVENKGKNYLKIVEETKNRYIPIHFIVNDILKDNPNLFSSLLSHQRFNEFLKELGKEVFEKEVEEGKLDYLHLSTDTAKKTFVILLYNKSVNIETILYYSGYKHTPLYLMRYIDMNKNEKELFIEHPFFERN